MFITKKQQLVDHRESVGYFDGANIYYFELSNPVSAVDPLGLDTEYTVHLDIYKLKQDKPTEDILQQLKQLEAQLDSDDPLDRLKARQAITELTTKYDLAKKLHDDANNASTPASKGNLSKLAKDAEQLGPNKCPTESQEAPTARNNDTKHAELDPHRRVSLHQLGEPFPGKLIPDNLPDTAVQIVPYAQPDDIPYYIAILTDGPNNDPLAPGGDGIFIVKVTLTPK